MPTIIGKPIASGFFITVENKDCSKRRKKGENVMKTTALSRILTSKMALAMILSSTMANTYADRGRDGHSGRGGDRGSERDYERDYSYESRGGTSTLSERLNRYLNQGERIDLLRELRLSDAFRRGQQLVSLTVDAQGTQHGSKLMLIMDGQTIGQAQLSSRMDAAVFRIPAFTSPRELKLAVVGGAYLAGARAEVSSPTSGSPSGGWSSPSQRVTLQANMDQWLEGRQVVPVDDLIRRSNPSVQFRGMSLNKIILIAEARDQRRHGGHGGYGRRGGHGRYELATAQLLINGRPVGYPQTITERETSLHFTLPDNRSNTLGEEITSVDLEITGSVHARMVVAELESNIVAPVIARLNKSFYGNERLTMAQLLRSVPGVNTQTAVESITLVTRGRGKVTISSSMGTVQGMVEVSGRARPASIRVVDGSDLTQLALFIAGSVTIEEVRVNYQSRYSRY